MAFIWFDDNFIFFDIVEFEIFDFFDTETSLKHEFDNGSSPAVVSAGVT